MPPKSITVLYLYGTRAISPNAKASVPRLLAGAIEALSEERPDWRQGNVICPPGGGAGRATFKSLELGLAEKLAIRFARKMTRVSHDSLWSRKAVEVAASDGITPDIAICVTVHGPTVVRKRFPQTKIIYWIHSLPGLGGERQVLQAIESSDALITPTRALYQALWQLYNRRALSVPVWVVPHRLDEQRFAAPSKAQRVQRRAALGLAHDDLAIIHAGGDAPHKGRHVVEQALRLCDFSGRRAVLFAAGGAQRQRRKVGARIEVVELGNLTPEQLAEVYQAGDLGVVSSLWWENSPLALIEMMFAGLCVVGSNSGGIPEILQHQTTGLIIDSPNDLCEWAAAFEQVASNEQRRAEFGDNARKSAVRRFGAASREAPEQWRKLFDTLLA